MHHRQPVGVRESKHLGNLLHVSGHRDKRFSAHDRVFRPYDCGQMSGALLQRQSC
ncbi:MAG TPA: hypothetical protein VGG59_08505 [Acidobacteriaceae bacterium]